MTEKYNARSDLMRSGIGIVWYVLYIILNIFSFGLVWFTRNLLTYAIKKSRE